MKDTNQDKATARPMEAVFELPLSVEFTEPNYRIRSSSANPKFAIVATGLSRLDADAFVRAVNEHSVLVKIAEAAERYCNNMEMRKLLTALAAARKQNGGAS